MARARVELKGCVSYTVGGRVWKKRKPQILTNESEIAKYQSIGDFSVTILKEESRSKAKDKPAPTPPEPEPETDDDGNVIDAEEAGYAKADLKKFSKKELVAIGTGLDLDLDKDSKKSDLIEEILEAEEEAE